MDNPRRSRDNSLIIIVVIIFIILILAFVIWFLLSRNKSQVPEPEPQCTFTEYFNSEWLHSYPTAAQCGNKQVSCDSSLIELDHPLDTTDSIYTNPRTSLYDDKVYFAKETVTEKGTCIEPVLSLKKAVTARYADFLDPIQWDPINDVAITNSSYYNFDGTVAPNNGH